MSNIGRKVRIKNYPQFSNKYGQIGVITEDNPETEHFQVKFENGGICHPYRPDYEEPQCEFVEEEFVLPQKWYLAVTGENNQLIGGWRIAGKCGIFDPNHQEHIGYVLPETGMWINNAPKGYTEITTEQFKTHVLKQTNMYQYKFRFGMDKYQAAANSIVGTTNIESFDKNSFAYNKLKVAGVLDVWFEEVIINPPVKVMGYEAVKSGDSIKFGCQYIPIITLEAIRDLMTRQEFTTELKIGTDYITLNMINKLLAL